MEQQGKLLLTCYQEQRSYLNLPLFSIYIIRILRTELKSLTEQNCNLKYIVTTVAKHLICFRVCDCPGDWIGDLCEKGTHCSIVRAAEFHI